MKTARRHDRLKEERESHLYMFLSFPGQKFGTYFQSRDEGRREEREGGRRGEAGKGGGREEIEKEKRKNHVGATVKQPALDRGPAGAVMFITADRQAWRQPDARISEEQFSSSWL